jgi:hypothetical protein
MSIAAHFLSSSAGQEWLEEYRRQFYTQILDMDPKVAEMLPAYENAYRDAKDWYDRTHGVDASSL